MMNREEALKWLIDNLEAWPESIKHTYSKDFELPIGKMKWYETWEYINSDADDGLERQATVSVGKRMMYGRLNDEERVTKQNWLDAKQPAQLTRDQALAWLVENVKVWPNSPSDAATTYLKGWKWASNPKYGFSFYSISEVEILKEDWQAAQPAPVSNKPSWDDAPAEANILVQSANGKFNFGSFPYASVDGGGAWLGEVDGKWFPSIQGEPNPNWRDTLEYRPATESKNKDGTFQNGNNHLDGQYQVLEYVPKNLARIKQLNDDIAMAQLSIETMQIELAERNKEVLDVLNYCKFNA